MMIEDRPWGSFQVLYEEGGFKVKIITVLPGKRLSYQSHKYRTERWVIISGTAEITIEEKIYKKGKGGIVEINLQQKHRLANSGDEILKIIEVQIGDYLGEDDIIRYEDDFGRV